MPDNPDIVLKIRVLDPQGDFLAGTADIEFQHRTLSDHALQRNLDASREIDISGLRRAPTGDYQVTVTPSDDFEPQSQFIDIPASGSATMEFVFRKDDSETPPPGPAVDPIYTVDGAVSSTDRAGVGGLRVQIVDKNVGSDITLAEAVTNSRGSYTASFSARSLRERHKKQPDLQARVYAGQTFLAASAVRYSASTHEVLHVNLPANSAALPAEYETLTAAVAQYYSGRLGDLKESASQRDITYLANKTGWDARAIALAALADQFSQRSGAAEIPPVFFYALFRAGLDTNDDALYHTDPRTLTAIWNKAADQGVIPKSVKSSIAEVVSQFQALSAQKLLTGPAVAGVSSLKEMLDVSGLNDAQQQLFAALYAAHRADPPALWKAVADALGANTASRLQLDGKLAFLTLNNATLMQRLHSVGRAGGLSDPLQLAQAGYHRAAKWSALLNTSVAIPKEIPGDTPEAKRANYSEYLAAQVRLSYPTAVVAEMVLTGDLAVDVPGRVHSFLTENQGKFEIGVQPVQQFIARNGLQVADEIVTQVKRLQRVYQITPDDQAMAGLLKRGIDAAYYVVRYRKEAFVEEFAQDLGGTGTAEQVYDKSVQIHNAVLNVAVGYLTAKNGLHLGGVPLQDAGLGSPTGGQILQPAPKVPVAVNVVPKPAGAETIAVIQDAVPKGGGVIAYATLESLFGSMDFCACDHCRSILSPAAYLVDLLLFLDQEPSQADKNNGKVNPQTVFLERRPDAQHVPLTCENTNTAVPYIDLVNETMEYFIANDVTPLALTDGKGHDYQGHDTNGMASEDLLASPQFAMDAAYAILRGELFPAPLPFHQPLENLRRYFQTFGVPLPLAMELLRPTDLLDDKLYGWRDILIEELRLSRAEYDLLTDASVTLQRVYGFAGTEADAIAELSNAKRFARRVDITYDDLIGILKTRFVNPNSDLIPKLERLGVSFDLLAEVNRDNKSDQKFDDVLKNMANPPDPAEYAGDIKVWVKTKVNFNRIMALITLTDPTGSGECNFDKLEFRHATPVQIGDTSTRLSAVEFVRLLRFIRLWKKMGWTIEQTDAAICALFPVPPFPLGADVVNDAKQLDTGFALLLPWLGIVVRVMRALNLTPGRDLLPLLACWSEIDTHGDSALYREMFLNPTILSRDDVFKDNGYGEFLDRDPAKKNNPDKLADHRDALQSAFNLTANEFERILAALGFDDKTPLTMANISAVHRWGWLARKLRLSVRELLLLGSPVKGAGVTGLDPFAAPNPSGAVNPAILELIGLMQALKARSLKSAEALYLIWNQDLSGKSTPDPAQITEFARTLRGDFAAIEDQFAATEDPSGNIARARVALVYGQEATGTFFALLDDTLVVDVAYTHPQAALEPAIATADPDIAYDDFRHRLLHTGLLSMQMRDALNKVPAVSDDFKKAVGGLFDRGEDIKGSFFARYRELEPLYKVYVRSLDPVAVRRKALLAALDPGLSRQRKRQQALQRLSAAVGVGLEFTGTMMDPPIAPGGPYPLHAAQAPNRPALDDVLALENQGLAVQFFFGNTAAGKADLSFPAAANLDYAKGSDNHLPGNQGATISGIWSGFVEAPEAGFFNIAIQAGAGAAVKLSLGGKDRPLTQNGEIRRNTGSLELIAGTLYEIVVTVEAVKDALSIHWETPKRPREVIPGRYLYPPSILGPFSDAYLRFLKAASLASALLLTANEMARFTTGADYQVGGDGWLNALPVSGKLDPNIAAALLRPFQALLDFARIKAGLSPGDERLLTILEDPAAATANPDSLLFTLARWDKTSLDAILKHFDGVIQQIPHLERFGNLPYGALADFDLFRRVYDAFVSISAMGISASALIRATTNEPSGDAVRDLQAALRARYAAADWRKAIKPINDTMRSLQRDALVAYILHQFHKNQDLKTASIDTADKLFEYFLMDVQMEPCMQTSRIRHVLSSVQLFVERCLMNLEPYVSPASINASQWAWMKRYRMWEANRKIFLFPENWLEPELRDDKSPFFRELESELLQADITEGSATNALLNYLAKLEEVAKLEPCGIYHREADPQRDHVVARTAGAHRKYFYRHRSELGYWTPWAQVKLDIEDNPVMPVVWNGRLLLFWLRIMTKGPDSPQGPGGHSLSDMTLPPAPKTTVQAMLCWSEYFNGKWQPTKTSDAKNPAVLRRDVAQNAFDRSQLRLEAKEVPGTNADPGGLRVNILGASPSAQSFLLYNTHSLPLLDKMDPITSPTRALGGASDPSGGQLSILYYNLDVDPDFSLKRDILLDSIPFTAVEPDHSQLNVWDAPFFFADSRHVFYVTTTEKLVTLSESNGFGMGFRASEPAGDLPPLVLQGDPSQAAAPDSNGLVTNGPGFGITDPSPMERLVSEDAYIHTGIGASGSVRYSGVEIGPAGALLNQQIQHG